MCRSRIRYCSIAEWHGNARPERGWRNGAPKSLDLAVRRGEGRKVEGDRCDLNSSESRPHEHEHHETDRTSVQPVQPRGAGRSCRTSREYTTGYLAVGTAYSDRRPRIRVSDPKTVISRQKPHREGDFQSPPGLELDCPVRNPCRATHSSSGVERLPWE